MRWFPVSCNQKFQNLCLCVCVFGYIAYPKKHGFDDIGPLMFYVFVFVWRYTVI
jgi:hypothetical protein